MPVHPRVCGERLLGMATMAEPIGSSPRVRGTDDAAPEVRIHVRFIPACAGNGASHRRRWRVAPVHPRVCGERGRYLGSRAGENGSSPRVRGTVGAPLHRSGGDRFIPACAGNGMTERFDDPETAVHPRVCGERAMA